LYCRLFRQLLPSNGCFSGSTVLASSKYARIWWELKSLRAHRTFFLQGYLLNAWRTFKHALKRTKKYCFIEVSLIQFQYLLQLCTNRKDFTIERIIASSVNILENFATMLGCCQPRCLTSLWASAACYRGSTACVTVSTEGNHVPRKKKAKSATSGAWNLGQMSTLTLKSWLKL
jgi:hypothetical protein